MIRVTIVVVAIVLALTGVALAWTGSRDSSPGDPIQLPDVRQEDTKISPDPDDDGTGDPDADGTGGPDNDSIDSTDHSDTSISRNSSSDSSWNSDTTFSVSSLSSDSSLFGTAPPPTAIIKPRPTTNSTGKPPTTTHQRNSDDSVSLYSYDSFSIDSVSSAGP